MQATSTGPSPTSSPAALDQSAPRRPPQRFTKAPWPLAIDDIGAHQFAAVVPGIETPLPFGVRPDTGEVLWLDPLEDGRAYRIIGPPKSGRSSALAALAVLGRRAGWAVMVASASRRSPLLAIAALADVVVPVERVVDLIGGEVARPTLLLIDDAHRLGDDFAWQRLATLERGLLVTVVAGSTEALTKSTGVMRTLNAPNGVAMMPTRTRDAGGVGINVIDEAWVVQPLARNRGARDRWRGASGAVPAGPRRHRSDTPLASTRWSGFFLSSPRPCWCSGSRWCWWGVVGEAGSAVLDQPAPRPSSPPPERGGPVAPTPVAPAPAAPDAPPAEVAPLKPRALRERLAKARSTFAGAFGGILGRATIDADTWDDLEEALLRADVGLGVAEALLDGLKQRVKSKRSPSQRRCSTPCKAR